MKQAIDTDKWQIFRKRLRDKIFNLKRYIYEIYRKNIYRLRNFKEAKQTQDYIYLIYTMGKVASMSVLDAITKRLPHIPVFAMHYLNETNLKIQEQQLGNSEHLGNQLYKKIHTLHAEKIKKCIEKHPHKQIKIVTLIREPINQIISQIFQQLNLHDIHSLKKMTLDNQQIDYDYPAEWCKNELELFSGIDILKEPFNPDKGYEIYCNGRFSVLVIRFEDINRIFPEAMSEYSGVSNWILGEKNKADNKKYAIEYKTFKKELEIESALLEKVYSSSFVNHFYTKEEVLDFRKQWKTFSKLDIKN